MAEIDPVILQLKADVAQYRVDVISVSRRVNDALDSQGKAAARLEHQIKASSESISSSFKSMAASVAAGLSVEQIGKMADAYTRFTNSLKVAGLQGSALASVQNTLFTVAQRNGVELDAVGTLYSRAAQNQKELGASTTDLIDLTKAVSASLRISGVSTTEASGALLQLSQALGEPRVQAEEFNSLLDTMQPLLREASKYIDGTGGSLSGLTRIIKAQNGPGVSNVAFFRALVKATSELEKQASSAQLTIAGAFTNLSNAMTKYIGEADHANDASLAVTGALNALANNLDTVTEAIAVLSAVMIGRFVAGMIAGAASSTAMSTALFALQARAAGAATTVEALSLVSATAGRSMLAAFGGPVGLAVTALTVGIGYLYSKQQETNAAATALSASIDEQTAKYAGLHAEQARVAAETNNLTSEQRAALTATANLTGEADKLSQAWARVAAQAKAAAVEQAKATLDSDRANYRKAQATYENKRDNTSGEFSLGAAYDTMFGPLANATPAQAKKIMEQRAAAEKKQRDDAARNVQDSRRIYDRILSEPLAKFTPPATPPAPGAAGSKGKGARSSASTGPDPAEVARKFADDLAQGEQQIQQAQADALGTSVARRELEAAQVEYERQRNARQIEGDKDYTEAQKTQLLQQNERIAAEKRAAISADALREAQDQQKDAAENSARLAEDALHAEAAIAKTREDRLAAENRILDSLEQQEKDHLEAQIATGQIANAEKARADLATFQSARRTETQQNNESPLTAYARKLGAASVNDQVEGYVVDELKSVQDSISSGLTKAIGTKDPIITGLINMFIEQVIMRPIANAFASAQQSSSGGGLGGIFGSILSGVSSAFGSGATIGGQTGAAFSSSLGSSLSSSAASVNIPGFATGTNYAPGGVALVGEKGPELVELPRGSRVVPNNMMNARAASSMASTPAAGMAAARPQQVVVSVQANDYFDARVDQRAANVATPISQQHATQAGQAAYKQSMKDAPGSVRRAQRFRTTG